MSVPHGYAQTNLQLYTQLRQGGYSPEDLNHIRLAYEFASELFTCQHRPSGKSLLSHLIGTASILGSLHVSKEIIAAVLLHIVYLPNAQDRLQPYQQWRQAHIELPTFLGYPTLSSELSRAIDETLGELGSHSVPVQNSISRIWPFTILPLSHHYRLLISLRCTVAKIFDHLARRREQDKRHPIVAKIMASPMIRFLKKRILFMSKA